MERHVSSRLSDADGDVPQPATAEAAEMLKAWRGRNECYGMFEMGCTPWVRSGMAIRSPSTADSTAHSFALRTKHPPPHI